MKDTIPDRAGNMGYAVKDFWVPSAASGTPETKSYEYNDAGNTVGITNIQQGTPNVEMELDWDERYRLKSVKSAQSVDVFYQYDVLNRRTSRSFVEATSPSLTNTVHYIYNSNQIVADLDGSGNLLRTYVWGQGIDNLLSMTVYSSDGGVASTNTYYAIKDHQNTVIALVNTSGLVVESYEYDAYGNILNVKDGSGNSIANQQSEIGNRYTFQGREIDWTTSLYYFRARWYDPDTGRWLSKDPIGISGGLNLYVFCDNNPGNFIDPFGLDNLNLHAPGSYEAGTADLAGTSDKYYTVGGHGYSDGSGILDQRGSSKGTSISAHDLAKEIMSDKNYDPSKPVKLIACLAGSADYAQKLANELNNSVIASTTVITRNTFKNIFTGKPLFHPDSAI